MANKSKMLRTFAYFQNMLKIMISIWFSIRCFERTSQQMWFNVISNLNTNLHSDCSNEIHVRRIQLS